jgi:hypothetical protein
VPLVYYGQGINYHEPIFYISSCFEDVRVFSDESKLETLKISTFLRYTTRNVKMWQMLELANIEDDILSLVSILSLF